MNDRRPGRGPGLASSIKHGDVNALSSQSARQGQSGRAGSDDGDVDLVRHR